jgi:hypothetical protein
MSLAGAVQPTPAGFLLPAAGQIEGRNCGSRRPLAASLNSRDAIRLASTIGKCALQQLLNGLGTGRNYRLPASPILEQPKQAVV